MGFVINYLTTLSFLAPFIPMLISYLFLNQIFIRLLFDKGRNDINLSAITTRQKGQ